MSRINKETPFPELLEICSEPTHAAWQLGWKELVRRYKNLLYKVATLRSLKYNTPRVKAHRSEIVNDAVTETFRQLYKNGCRALRKFKARDNEKKFRSWLATIANRSTSDHIQKYFLREDLDERDYDLKGMDLESRWELYEDVVTKLRLSKNKRQGNLERNIHIFKLYIWCDFTTPMIQSLPCFKTLGDRVVDNAVHRLRDYLRDQNDLRG